MIFNFNNNAQGTIEYLIILAVVVVVGLVVVSLSTAFIGDGGQVIDTSDRIDNISTSGIVVVDGVVDTQGDSILELKNTTGKTFTLTKIGIDGNETNYNTKMRGGDTLTFSFSDTGCVCGDNDTTKTCIYEVSYKSESGVIKKDIVETKLNCVDEAKTTGYVVKPILVSDTINPEIVLLSPDDSLTIDDYIINFSYSVTDDSEISNCSLLINGVVDQIDSDGSYGTFIKNLNTKGDTNWSINCVDSSNNSTTTISRTINLENNYLISTCSELNNMDNNLNGSYQLINNIDCSGINFDPIGNYFTYMGYCVEGQFNGDFNGNNFTINNINNNLFECIHDGSISNLKIKNMNTTGNGAIAQQIENNTLLENIEVIDSNIFNNSNDSGGLVGYANSSSIKNSKVIADISSNTYAGGLVGYANSSSIENSYVQTYLTGITGVNGAGGLVGRNTTNTITKSFSTAKINGTGIYFNGVVGAGDFASTFTNVYWDTETSTKLGGGSGQVSGKTTAEMMQESTFVGFDFDNIWSIDEGNDYPRLQWENN